MMTFISKVLLICLLVVGWACDRRSSSETVALKQPEFVIRWEHGVTLFSAIYSFDGVIIGRGRGAYSELVSKIDKVPDGAHLRFNFPSDVAALLTEISGVTEPLPFRGYDLQREEFMSLQTRKHLRITIDAFESPEFTE